MSDRGTGKLVEHKGNIVDSGVQSERDLVIGDIESQDCAIVGERNDVDVVGVVYCYYCVSLAG